MQRKRTIIQQDFSQTLGNCISFTFSPSVTSVTSIEKLELLGLNFSLRLFGKGKRTC